jgi:hypothetical protein
LILKIFVNRRLCTGEFSAVYYSISLQAAMNTPLNNYKKLFMENMYMALADKPCTAQLTAAIAIYASSHHSYSPRRKIKCHRLKEIVLS